MKLSTKRLTFMALMTAISVVLVYLVRLPIIPAAPFLEYDPADIPIFYVTFLLGTPYGLLLTVVVSVIQGLTVSAGSGPIGIVMHIFATGSYCIAAGLTANRTIKKTRLLLAAFVGVIVMTGSMVLWNLLITPYYLNVPLSAVQSLLVPAIIPFNLIKAGLNSVAAVLLAMTIRVKI